MAVTWPVRVCRADATYCPAWIVYFHWPRLHFLNAYSVELDYMLARSPDGINS